MIGAAAFNPLKAGVWRQQSAKQAEIRLAGLPTILNIGPIAQEKSARRTSGAHARVVGAGTSARYG
jgi:hypothetical protein